MGKLTYDLKTPEVDESAFNHNKYWKDFYGDVEEELPQKMAEPRVNVRQNTVEAEKFGSDFVALRICKELIVALRYKLHIFF